MNIICISGSNQETQNSADGKLMVKQQLNTSHKVQFHHVNCILSDTGRGMGSTEGNYYPPIICNDMATLSTVSPISLLILRNLKESSEELSVWPGPRANNLSGETWELALLQLARRKAKGKPHGSLQCPEGKIAIKPLSVVTDEIMKGSNYCLHVGRVRVDVRKDFSPKRQCRLEESAHKFCETPVLEGLQDFLEKAISQPETGLVRVLLLTGDWTRNSQRILQPECQ